MKISSLLGSFFVGIGGIFILALTITTHPITTIFLFLAVLILGLWLCYRTSIELEDPKLKILSFFWLLKLIATFFLLYVGWMPQLDPINDSWGYDPQRYYFDAWGLVENDWVPVSGLSFQGIVYYYGVIFYFFGHNPAVPALINSFLTLFGTLFLIKSFYALLPNRTSKDWVGSGLLLLPEILWYDVMTSRESILWVCAIIFSYSFAQFWLINRKRFPTRDIISILIALLVIVVIRPTLALFSVIIMLLFFMLIKKVNSRGAGLKTFLLSLVFCAIGFASFIQGFIGNNSVDYIALLINATSHGSNTANLMGWSHNSIGLLFAPNNIFQSVAFLPARMLLYLLAPLPYINFSLQGLIDGSWSDWQNIIELINVSLTLICMPYLMAGMHKAWRVRHQNSGGLAMQVIFWAIFVTVVGGNIIIHQRYRTMFLLPLWTCIWFGYTRCTFKEVKNYVVAWFYIVLFFAIFSICYKIFNF